MQLTEIFWVKAQHLFWDGGQNNKKLILFPLAKITFHTAIIESDEVLWSQCFERVTYKLNYKFDVLNILEFEILNINHFFLELNIKKY